MALSAITRRLRASWRGAPTAAALAVAAVCWGMPVATAAEPEKATPRSRLEVELSFAPVVKKVAPAVVNIFAQKQVGSVRSPIFDDPLFRRFFGENFGFGSRRPRIEKSLGSGVIVRADGLIVTNNHVIKNADEITVALADGREFLAEIVLADKRTDLAVLRIDVGDGTLPTLEFRDSDDLEVGDPVLAIGNPFGVGQTVTSGIVSALARSGIGVTDYQFFIQTDAAINPGNSGGPLVTLDGRIAGINTAIFSRSGGSLGIGFAIPANMVAIVVRGAVSGGKIVRPWLGASGQTLTTDIAASLGLERPTGVLINDVFDDGPAARAGLQMGDVVVGADGRPVQNPAALMYRIATRPTGGTLTLSLLRDGTPLVIEVELLPAPENPERDVTLLEGAHPIAGASVGNLSPAFAEELGINTLAKGVIVLSIARGSPSHRLRLRPGDILLSVNGERIESVEGLQEVLEVPAGQWRISLRRGDQKLNLVVRG